MEMQAVGHAQGAGNDNVTEMARTMDVARQCEIVADNTQVLNADWGKIHNPWENVQPHQVKRWREGQCPWTSDRDRVYVFETEGSSYVYSVL